MVDAGRKEYMYMCLGGGVGMGWELLIHLMHMGVEWCRGGGLGGESGRI